MLDQRQRTLKEPVRLSGVGIHTGSPAVITIHPAEENSGRVFLTPDGVEVPARVDHVVSCRRSTVLGRGEARVHTVEHLLSALVACGVDNARIELTGLEVPILDGSARPFLDACLSVGLERQQTRARVIAPQRPHCVVGAGQEMVLVIPAEHTRYEYVLHYEHPMLGCQTVEFELGKDAYSREIAPARTFALWEEVKPLLDQGLALGGDIDNALVIFQDKYSSPLKVENEPVRHKCLDLIGDFALLEARLQARVLAVKAGHRLHVECARKVWEETLVHESA